MKSPISLVLLIVGIVLLILGISASDSLGSDFSRFFTGSPTDRTIWMLIGGVVFTAVGLRGITLKAK